MLTPKILIAVMGCHHREDRTDLQRRTWLSHGPWDSRVTVRFFRGKPQPGGPFAKNHGDEMILNVPDDYAGMCQKARMVYHHAFLNCYDFTLTTGDDTWVHIPRLVDYCTEIWNGGRPLKHYVGHLRGETDEFGDDYASGGPGTLFSAHALRLLNAAPPTDDPAEDRWAGNVLRSHRITLHSDKRHFCLPAEWRDRYPWEIITVETTRVHRGELASMKEIDAECYEARILGR